jgi:hypothetical protein
VRDFEKVLESAKAAVMPFESWERLPGENAGAFAAFCAFRDYGPERNIRKAAEAAVRAQAGAETGEAAARKAADGSYRHPCDDLSRAIGKRYRVWRQWAVQYKWRERAADYDTYLDGLRREEQRKTIEAQGEVHRMITGKMLNVVSKKLDLMAPEELKQETVTEWVETAIKAEREAAGLVTKDGKESAKSGATIAFQPEFEGL